MTGRPPLSSPPMDPYEWRESVLSTRSLSYLSQADAFGSQSRQSSNAHMFRPPTRRSTLDSMDEGLELFVPGQAQHRLEDINELPALPASVARSLLFTLPREIRDRVYTYCLSIPAGESLEWPTKPQTSNAYMLAPQLLRTCKLVSAEALPVLYSSNSLSFLHPSDANMFVRAMASPIARSKISRVFLVVKTQDQSLWTNYLHSTDKVRSLKEDFPALRDLTVRYVSNKWQHNLPVEANLRHWSDDGRLNSIINGITNVYFPHHRDGKSKAPDGHDLSETLPDASPPREINFKRGLQEHRKAQVTQTQLPPTMKIICACRIHSTHFAALTSNVPLPAPVQLPAVVGNAIPPPPPPPPAPPGLPLPGVAALLDGILPNFEPVAVEEGEEFRGFTHVDFKGRLTKVLRSAKGGEKEVVQIVRTVFARKGKVLLALEVFAADSTQ